MVGQVTQLGVLQWIDTDFSGETGWKDQEWGSLRVKKLLGCMELLYGASDKLGEPLRVRVRGGARKGDIVVGGEEPAVRVGKLA